MTIVQIGEIARIVAIGEDDLVKADKDNAFWLAAIGFAWGLLGEGEVAIDFTSADAHGVLKPTHAVLLKRIMEIEGTPIGIIAGTRLMPALRLFGFSGVSYYSSRDEFRNSVN